MNSNADKGFLLAYGALVALYPREFRDEYGADATHASAYDDYLQFLAESGFNLEECGVG